MFACEDQIISFSGWALPLPGGVLAIGLEPGEDRGALLLEDGTIARITQQGIAPVGAVSLPWAPRQAAIDPGGRMIAIDNGDAMAWHDGQQWRRGPDPDWLGSFGAVGVAVDGRSVGCTYQTEQPYGEWGSYGFRLRVTDLFGASDQVFFEQDIREHDEHAPSWIHWRSTASPLISGDADGVEITWWVPVPTPIGWDDAAELCVPHPAPPRSIHTSRCGAVVAGVSGDGTLWVADRRRGCVLQLASDALGAHLQQPNQITWLDRQLRPHRLRLLEALPEALDPLLDGTIEHTAVLRDWALQHRRPQLLRQLACYPGGPTPPPDPPA